MKKKLFTISLAFIALNSFAQITVMDTDLIDVGDVIYQATDSVPGSVITPGNPGANQTWDFSSLQVMDLDTLEFISPSGTPFANMHPTANLCIDDDDEFVYIEKNSNGVSIVGVDTIQITLPLLPLPLIYGMSQTFGPTVVMDNAMENAFIPDSLALYITNFQAQKVDSFGIQVEVQTDFDVDAYGFVTIPLGTYDALRLKTNQITTTSFFVYCTDTLLGGGAANGWYSIPSQFWPSEVEVITSYQWWTNDPVARFAVAEIEVDSVGNVEDVQFLTIPQTSSVLNLENIHVNVYPNPTSTDLMVKTDLINCSYNLIDVKGSKLLCNEFNNSTIIDLSSYLSGTYFLQIYTEEGNVTTKRIVVE